MHRFRCTIFLESKLIENINHQDPANAHGVRSSFTDKIWLATLLDGWTWEFEADELQWTPETSPLWVFEKSYTMERWNPFWRKLRDDCLLSFWSKSLVPVVKYDGGKWKERRWISTRFAITSLIMMDQSSSNVHNPKGFIRPPKPILNALIRSWISLVLAVDQT